MADFDNGYPMNNGGPNGPDDEQLLKQFMSMLEALIDKNSQSVTKQLQDITSVLKDASKVITKGKTDQLDFNKQLKNLSSGMTKIVESFEDSGDSLADSLKNISEQIEDIDIEKAEDIRKKRQLEIDRKLAEEQQKNVDRFTKYLKNLDEVSKQEIKKRKRNIDSLPDGEEREKAKAELKKYLESVENKKERAQSTYDKKNRQLTRQARKDKDAIPEYKDLDLEVVKKVKDQLDSIKNSSPYLNERLGGEKSDLEKFNEEKEAKLKILRDAQKTLTSYKKKLDQDFKNGKINAQQLKEGMENAEKQEESLKETEKAINDWTLVGQSVSEAAKSMKDFAKNLPKDLAKFAISRLEDKYLEAYKEGFNKVYQSVENTRNSISARSKLDQGGFADLQNQIQDEIEKQGLENVVSQAEVNEALVQLSASGVTDTQMLKTLALEQAKLKASGSDLNISNEETLQQLQEFITNQMSKGNTYDEALSQIPQLMNEILTSESQLTDLYGHRLGISQGQENKILNEVLNMANSSNKSMEETAADITAAMNASQAQISGGFDPDMLMTVVRELQEGNITQGSPLLNILRVNGLTPENLSQKPLEEALNEVSDTLVNVLTDMSGGNEKYVKEISDVLGFSGADRKQLIRLLQGKLDIKEIPQEERQKIKEDQQQALQEGRYQSATLNHQTKAENKMAEMAIKAEQYYKGDTYIQEGFKQVENILGIISDSVINIAESALKQGGFSGVGSALSSSLGPTATNFLTGASGTTAGAVGTGLGVAAGAGIAGYSVVKNIQQYDGMQAVEQTFTDPTFYTGVGTALGSAIAGPLGGVIGGAIGNLSSNVGNWIEDWIDDIKDPLADERDAFKKQTEETLQNDAQELNVLTATLSKYQKAMDEQNTESMKLMLLEESNIDAQTLADKDASDIQAIFKQNLLTQQENLVREKENQLALDSILNENAEKTAELIQDYTGLAYSQYGTDWENLSEKERSHFLASNISQFTGASKNIISDIGSRISEMQSMSGSDIDAYLLQTGTSAQAISSMNDKEKQEAIKAAVIKQYKQEAGITGETSALFETAMKNYDKNKKIYEEANSNFQEIWNLAVSNVESRVGKGKATKSDVMLEYLKVRTGEKFEDVINGSLDPQSWSEVGRNIQINEDLSANLIPGDIYKDKYSFRTGLTSVPYDDYPALLHAGERVLTKEEANAYNMLSSTAIKQIYGNVSNSTADSLSSYILNNLDNNVYNTGSSNVFSTRQYGVGNFERSINSQTESLSALLKQILVAIKGLSMTYYGANMSKNSAKMNVLKGNSNVTQLNTL